jgi:hypothetical protein
MRAHALLYATAIAEDAASRRVPMKKNPPRASSLLFARGPRVRNICCARARKQNKICTVLPEPLFLLRGMRAQQCANKHDHDVRPGEWMEREGLGVER